MRLKSKALAVAFLAAASTQATAAVGGSIVPNDRLGTAGTSILLEADKSASVADAAQGYALSRRALTDGVLVKAGEAPIFLEPRDAQSVVELRNGEIVIADAAVPEPESYAMFLAGLGIIAAVVRRRSASG